MLLTDGKFTLSLLTQVIRLLVKIYMTRVEGENTRLRHYLARLQTLLTSLPLRYRKTLCYSKSVEMLKYSIRLLLQVMKYRFILVFH
jgi:IS1 family transposase